MFPTTMSPKVLNVEKLEKKFAFLTKSRESIQGLSLWIIRHKEFYKEIVNQWFDALSRDLNALTMFYVANDVIQNCGRKKAPEYREAFATVLEEAVSLEKVKEIKTEVIRMITLWHDRSIYDDEFYKKLIDKLNDVEESESEEEELSEADVIANFKLENLINSLRTMKTLEDKLHEKEAFLEDIEEPGMTNIDNLIVKMDSQKELWKIDKFQKLVEDYLTLSDKVMAAKKDALLNLKYSGIFYSAQMEDAKKVAHAYRIYGKKVKIVEKSLSEKLATLPEPSPILEEKSPSIVPDSSPEYLSPSISPMSTVSRRDSQESKLELGTSPQTVGINLNVSPSNEKLKSPLAEISSSPVASTSAEKNASDEAKILRSPMILETEKNTVSEKLLLSPNLIHATKSTEKLLRSPSLAHATKSTEKILRSPNLAHVTKSTEKLLRSPNLVPVSKNTEKLLKSPTVADVSKNVEESLKKSAIADAKQGSEKILKSPITVHVPIVSSDDNMLEKNFVLDNSVTSNTKEETAQKLLKSSNENLDKISDTLEAKESLPTSKVGENSETKFEVLSDDDNIDFLLEKAYKEHQTKSKASFKRKIDILLKSKQSKSFKMSNEDSNINSTQESASESVVSASPMEIASYIKDAENVSSEKKIDISVAPVIKVENDSCELSASNVKKSTESTSEAAEDSKVDELMDVEQTTDKSDSNVSKSTPSSDSNLLQSFPDIPTELLKNILDKHRINMNLSFTLEEGPSKNEISSFSDESKKECHVKQNSTDNSNIKNNEQNPSASIDSYNALENKIKKLKNDEKAMSDTADTKHDTCKTVTSTSDSVLNAGIAEENSSTLKSTPLLENLQSVLECLTKKDSVFTNLKNSNIFKNMPSMPIENALNVYSCIMQHCKSMDSLNSVVNNNTPNASSTEFLNNEKFCLLGKKANIDAKGNSMFINNQSLLQSATDNRVSVSSKNDNLEIMDMEVDSDDENA